MPEPGRGEKIPLGIESGSEDIHDVPRVFLAQYHEKDMERLHHKLRQKQEETHKREEKRREEVEKVRSILFKFYLEQEVMDGPDVWPDIWPWQGTGYTQSTRYTARPDTIFNI